MQKPVFSNILEENSGIRYRDYYGADFRSLPESQRPRAKLIEKGPGVLLDRELLAIILNHGTKNKNVGIMADELIERVDLTKSDLTVDEIKSLTGLGEARACAILAVLELGRRYWGISGIKIRYPKDIFDVVRHHSNRKQEVFISVSLNGAHEVIKVRTVTVGLVNKTVVHPREVFADPITDRCAAICVCHNHPSGELIPSKEDDDVTSCLEAAADVLGIRFLDHLVFSDIDFYSYRRENRLREIPKPSWVCADGEYNLAI